MSKMIAILYSTLILIQSANINIEDFSKFNVLIEHANYHKDMYGDSFFEFLMEHYGEQVATHPNDHKEHDNLPFKKHQHLTCHVNSAFILTSFYLYPHNTPTYKDIPLNFIYKESTSLFEKPSVFQPPKLT
ncbi:hypothetical protein KFZ70_03845 [Tamlana fucoidanivorans]|uniref:Uncharacterized protein n=1 Tax=Allotamlana fucoidanivorans TaxID=2583814 RepID=A0A5C4SLX2_9FLAO|nr:hypothetical protein [Tamlana fucoidanivorans]TNJ44174.1 hypothetical protein FGF67_09075 [Tamlana fucoidanivorans]